MALSRFAWSPRRYIDSDEPRTDRALRSLMIASILAVISAAVLVITVVFWSATRSDEVARDRLYRIVAYALEKSVEKIPYDQESVAIWDDAVVNVRNAYDERWVNINLGVWMYDYFKHDRVYVLDAQDRILYAMAGGQPLASRGGATTKSIAPFVAKLRQALASGALDAYEHGKERIPRVADLTFVNERPAIVSVMPLVPDTNAVSQARGSECLIVSVRFLDSSFLPMLAEANQLKGVRYTQANDIAENEQYYPLKSQSGQNIGTFVWAPEWPGSTILSEILPVLAIGLLAVGVAMTFLIRILRAVYTELITSEAQSKHLAFHDPLTGLPNRAFFNDRLESALVETRSGKSNIALMFLDLDRFKQVNDTLGHPAGDELIRELAVRLRKSMNTRDVLARLGGDEFAIIKRDVQDQKDVEDFCHGLVAAVLQPFEVLGNQATVGISVGVAMAPQSGVERSELARKADIALYQAKNSGGRCYQFFTEEMGKTMRERRTLERELREAIQSPEQLEVVYQPIYATASPSVWGIEALVRWNHPRLGTVSPLVFVPIAEECGLVDQLGEWVLRETCKAAKGWELETIAVNVSPIQFRQPDFADRVLAILEETGVSPARLELEITESTLLDSTGSSAKALKVLRCAGVRIALDDFGTGYSSLSYLLKLEVDRMKIDRSFVRHLGESTRSYSIVQAIVTMARAVGVAVTAEGVETRAQQEFLTDVGCDHLQGYLFSKPLSAQSLDEFLAARKAAPKTAAA